VSLNKTSSGGIAVASYLLLYNGGSMPASEAEQKAIVEEWEAWYSLLGSAVVDSGNPFTPEVRSVSSEGKINDGPVRGFNVQRLQYN
jgi:hypothetical protein